MHLFDHTFYGNTILQWVLAAAIMIGAAVAGKLLYWVFGNLLKKLTAKSKTRFDDIVVDMIEEPAALAAFLGGTWYALGTLTLSEGAREWIGHAFQFVIILTAAWMLVRLFDALYEEYLVPIAEKSETDLDDQLLPIVRRGTKIAIWTVGLIIALNNAGYDVAAALAGLGIGGLALAMAGRDTVANMFGGLTIFVDQPFKLNDRVKVDGFDGTVKEIGLRSTRLETLEGRLVTIPNARFGDNAVENVSAEPARKIAQTLGLIYDTTPAQMRAAMSLLREIVAAHPGTEEKVVSAFTGFGDFSMNISFAYWVSKDADILETQSDINLSILERFAAGGLDMAFPTQTVIHQREEREVAQASKTNAVGLPEAAAVVAGRCSEMRVDLMVAGFALCLGACVASGEVDSGRTPNPESDAGADTAHLSDAFVDDALPPTDGGRDTSDTSDTGTGDSALLPPPDAATDADADTDAAVLPTDACDYGLIQEVPGPFFTPSTGAPLYEMAPPGSADGFRCLRLEFDVDAPDNIAAMAAAHEGCPVFLQNGSIHLPEGRRGVSMASSWFRFRGVGCVVRDGAGLEVGVEEESEMFRGSIVAGRRYHVVLEVDRLSVARLTFSVDGARVGPVKEIDITSADRARSRGYLVRFGLPAIGANAYFPYFGATFSDLRVYADARR